MNTNTNNQSKNEKEMNKTTNETPEIEMEMDYSLDHLIAMQPAICMISMTCRIVVAFAVGFAIFPFYDTFFLGANLSMDPLKNLWMAEGSRIITFSVFKNNTTVSQNVLLQSMAKLMGLASDATLVSLPWGTYCSSLDNLQALASTVSLVLPGQLTCVQTLYMLPIMSALILWVTLVLVLMIFLHRRQVFRIARKWIFICANLMDAMVCCTLVVTALILFDSGLIEVIGGTTILVCLAGFMMHRGICYLLLAASGHRHGPIVTEP